MIVLDTSFLVDYLRGKNMVAEVLEEYDEAAYYAPTMVLYEIYEGAARHEGSSIEAAKQNLDWVEILDFDHGAAQEAARINAELLRDGNDINDRDILIAGVCRRYGAKIITRDDHFDNVDGLETVIV